MNFSLNSTEKDSDKKDFFTVTEIVTGTIIVTILMVVAFFGNLFTCYVHIKKSCFRTLTNISISVLSMSDILMAIFVMPLSLVSFTRQTWPFSSAACTFNAFLVQALLGVTFITMAFTAIIRYLCVVRPSLHRRLKPKSTVILLFLAWTIYLALLTFPIMVDSGYGGYSNKRSFCILRYTKKTVSREADILRLSLGTLMEVIILLAYYRVFRFMSHHNKTVLPNLQQGNRLHVEETKITRTLAFVVLGFALCWAPAGILQVLKMGFIKPSQIPVFMVFSQTIFIFASSAINPLIYVITNRRFRKEYLELTRRLLRLRAKTAPCEAK